MELLAVLILLSGFFSLSSAYKLVVQKFPLEYSKSIQELSPNFGSILPYENDATSESESQTEENEFINNMIHPRQRRGRNLRSLLNNLRGQYERKSVVNPLCFFTALPCR
uniref:Uncharacterized protein n=1 Tax=Panagrolaimus sp. ES5 TaxID=591445 RepID=A0AC34GFR1_9BILA